MILHGEIQRQRVGQSDKAAEGDEVEEHEPAAVGIAQQGTISLQRNRLPLSGRILGGVDVVGEDQQHRNEQHAEYGLPAPMFGDRRCEHRVKHDTHIAGAGDPHHHALILRRIPAACLRQRHRERGAADAERETEDLHRQLARKAEVANPRRCGDDDDLRDNSGPLGAESDRREGPSVPAATRRPEPGWRQA